MEWVSWGEWGRVSEVEWVSWFFFFWSHQWHEVLNWKYISICILINETRGSVLSIARYNPHWGRVTHICVSKLNIICSDNGLSPGRRQAIIWTNAGLLLIGSLGTNFTEISIGVSELVGVSEVEWVSWSEWGGVSEWVSWSEWGGVSEVEWVRWSEWGGVSEVEWVS